MLESTFKKHANSWKNVSNFTNHFNAFSDIWLMYFVMKLQWDSVFDRFWIRFWYPRGVYRPVGYLRPRQMTTKTPKMNVSECVHVVDQKINKSNKNS